MKTAAPDSSESASQSKSADLGGKESSSKACEMPYSCGLGCDSQFKNRAMLYVHYASSHYKVGDLLLGGRSYMGERDRRGLVGRGMCGLGNVGLNKFLILTWGFKKEIKFKEKGTHEYTITTKK